MFNILFVAEQFAETLSKVGDWFLYQPFSSALETMMQVDRLDGSFLIPMEWYLSLSTLFDFTIGELVFTSLIGLILGMKFLRFFVFNK